MNSVKTKSFLPLPRSIPSVITVTTSKHCHQYLRNLSRDMQCIYT